MVAENLFIFAAACLVMIISGTLLVRSLTKIAYFLKITEFAAAFIIMAVATSLPEMFVGISAAIDKNPALTLGNIFGANILDLTLITGIMILAGKGLIIKSKRIKKDSVFMSIVVLLPIVLFFIGNGLSRADGAILIAAFLFCSYRIIKRSKDFKKGMKESVKRAEIVLATLLFGVSLALLFVSAKYVVKYAGLLAVELSMPAIMVGLFMISVGTTLPELVFGVRAVLMGHSDMAIGDQIGTIIANSTLILGITALIYPIQAEFSIFLVAALFMLLVSFLFATFAESGSRFGIKEGIALMLLYAFFVFLELYISSIGIK